MTDSYFTLAAPSVGEFKDKGSRFIAHAAAAWSEEECQVFIEKIRKAHPKARHHCTAWRLGLDQNRFRANDDGEPSGTAGRPMLAQIDAAGLRNVVVVVVRYFGGTLLGTSGLLEAYRESTAQALRVAERVEKIVCDIWRLEFDYARMPDVMGAVKKLELEIVRQEFTENGLIELAIRQSEIDETLLRLKSLVLKKSLEEAALADEIEGLKMTFTEIR